jgi:hypothetical protein
LLLYAAPLIAMLISAIYFFGSKADDSLFRRILTSIHGFAMTALYAIAWAISMTRQSDAGYGVPYAIGLLVPAALIVLALFRFRGNKKLHWLQIPNVACLVWIGFIGGMAITGDWL